MRLNRTTKLLAQVAALGATAFFFAAAAAEDFSLSEEQRRILRSIGTEPDVQIEYDGSEAQCTPGTGRRLHGEQTDDPRCSDEHDERWELTYTLEANTITMISCSKDKVLEITSTNPGNKPTADDCNFLWNTASDIVQQPEYTDKHSLHSQLVKGIQLLCGNRPPGAGGRRRRLAASEVGWPAGLPISFLFDKDAEWYYQRPMDILFNGPDQSTHFNKPPEDFMYDPIYQSLCFAVDNKYVGDEGFHMAAAPTTTGPCAGEHDMHMGTDNDIEDMDCLTPPQNPDDTLNWATGNCFGRCGGGCDGMGELSQYTNDCVDYDFCTRFGIDREGPGNCHDEFLHTIDDTLWSGNCEDGTEVEPVPIDDCTDSPTASPEEIVVNPPKAAPTESPTSAPTSSPTSSPLAPTPSPFTFNFSPIEKVITFGVGMSCTDRCAEVSGNWECTQDSLYDNNFNQNFMNIGSEVHWGLGIMCDEIDLTMGTDPAVAMATTPELPLDESQNITCYASDMVRPKATFDCNAVPPAGMTRFCACYVAS